MIFLWRKVWQYSRECLVVSSFALSQFSTMLTLKPERACFLHKTKSLSFSFVWECGIVKFCDYAFVFCAVLKCFLAKKWVLSSCVFIYTQCFAYKFIGEYCNKINVLDIRSYCEIHVSRLSVFILSRPLNYSIFARYMKPAANNPVLACWVVRIPY